MGFKSQKNFCIAVCSSLAGLIASTALATVTATPKEPWALNGTAIYYAVNNVTAEIVDTDAGFVQLSTSATSVATDSGSLMVFTVKSDKTSFSGASATVPTLMHVYSGSSSGCVGTLTRVKIAAAMVATDGTPTVCSGDPCTKSASTLTYYDGVKYNVGETLRVGLFIKDICSADGTNPTISGCSSGSLDDSSTAMKQICLKFTFGVSDASDNAFPFASDGGTENDTSSGILANFESAGSRLISCPLTGDPFFPGDGQIILFPYKFTDTSTNYASGSSAPIDKLIIIGEQGANPDTATPTNNDIFARVSPSSGLSNVTGFQNGVNYNLNFSVRDSKNVDHRIATVGRILFRQHVDDDEVAFSD
jgi:hypothetical protein